MDSRLSLHSNSILSALAPTENRQSFSVLRLNSQENVIDQVNIFN